MVLPNFFIIGAAKSGTTALYRYLRQHPEIFMPDRKEPHHFSFDERTKLTNGPGDYVRTAITDNAQYIRLFANVKDEIAIGEASPTYIYIPDTSERIHAVIPNAKIISILRHPAERAFSAYMHLIRDGYETILDFDEALKKEPERIENRWGPIWHYTKSGFYYEQLERYYSVFNNNLIHVIIYDDFKKDPFKVVNEIFNFLEVDDRFRPDMKAKPNVSGIPKNMTWQKIIQYFFERDNIIRSISRKIFRDEFRWRFTSNIRKMNLSQPMLPLPTKIRLIELFREDILKLQDLINYDLSIWLKI